eukprot:jgi/Psemu1/15592/gm1.15592_g
MVLQLLQKQLFTTKLQLYKTVQKEFATYHPLEQGGPFFSQATSTWPPCKSIFNDDSEATLVDIILKNSSIPQNSDKDIPEVTSTIISSITSPVITVQKQHKEYKLPDEYK